MRSKYMAGVLALFIGVLGIHRFYLGQYIKGALYILLPPVLALLFFYFTNSLAVIKHTSTNLQSSILNLFDTWFVFFYAPVLFIALIDAIIFFAMSKEKFAQRYNTGADSSAKTTVISFFTFAVSVIVVILIYNTFFIETKVDVAAADADYELSATALASEFSEGEDFAFEKYGEKVVALQGEVINEEIMIATDDRSLILKGADDYIIKVNFIAAEADAAGKVKIGDRIMIKGLVFDVLNKEIILSNSQLINLSPGAKPDNTAE